MSGRRRLDAELVRRGLAPSRVVAQDLIGAGRVTVGGAPADKASRQVLPGDAVEVVGPAPRYVGRGGLKLEAALEHFGITAGGRRALDAGASTGGFTDCLLHHGATEVVAVDVGYGQLHERLRSDPRVRCHERTHVRDLARVPGLGHVPLVVADLSFISLTKVAGYLLEVCEAGADLILLVKPQFEAGRQEVARGRGIITDPDVWRRTVADVCEAFEQRGATTEGVMVSPIHGADGNTEFLVHLRAPRERGVS